MAIIIGSKLNSITRQLCGNLQQGNFSSCRVNPVVYEHSQQISKAAMIKTPYQ